jgi:Flp pilus assembly pilin Flp
MDTIKKSYARADRLARGQTMTEYAMILATIAIVCIAAYQLMATDLQTMLSNVDTLL